MLIQVLVAKNFKGQEKSALDLFLDFSPTF